MIRAIISLLIIALVAAVFGFGGIVVAAIGIAKIIFWVSLILLLITVVMNFFKKAT